MCVSMPATFPGTGSRVLLAMKEIFESKDPDKPLRKWFSQTAALRVSAAEEMLGKAVLTGVDSQPSRISVRL